MSEKQLDVILPLEKDALLEDPGTRLREWQGRAVRAENEIRRIATAAYKGSAVQKIVGDVGQQDGYKRGYEAMLDKFMTWLETEHPELVKEYWEYCDRLKKARGG